MKNLFIPYNLAFKLKEKGFDEPCLKSITETGFENDYSVLSANNWNKLPFVVSIPMYQQVVDWLREKHKLFIILNCTNTKYPNGHWECDVSRNNEIEYGYFGFETYYEALNKSIEEALKLI